LAGGAQDTGWQATADAPVLGITSDTGRIYVGGKFHNVDGVGGTGKLAALNPGTPARATRTSTHRRG